MIKRNNGFDLEARCGSSNASFPCKWRPRGGQWLHSCLIASSSLTSAVQRRTSRHGWEYKIWGGELNIRASFSYGCIQKQEARICITAWSGNSMDSTFDPTADKPNTTPQHALKRFIPTWYWSVCDITWWLQLVNIHIFQHNVLTTFDLNNVGWSFIKRSGHYSHFFFVANK